MYCLNSYLSKKSLLLNLYFTRLSWKSLTALSKSNSSNCTDIFNCQTQVQSNTLTFFEVPVSANPRFLICDYTFAPMRKCRCRFEVLPMKSFPSFSLKIKILAICNYISEKWLIAKVKIFKYTYLPSKNVMAEPQINDLHLMC